ncbi:thiamine pyrophosphate-binding protein, partial [Porticoccaceae bacterium]|nr:thiamine pyrophosphate-binding protein [Porticoccaceae bacterium]
MTNTGAQLVRYALEQLNIQHVFGVVSTHNREIYHELNSSATIKTHLVNQELSAAFMADAISRTSHISEAAQTNKIAEIGTMLITADAIISQGIIEAFVT